MKVGLLTSSISRKGGGVFHAVCGLARALRERRMPLEVFSLEDEWAEEDRTLWHPILPQTFRVAGPRAFGYAPGLGAGLQSEDLDLLHLHGLWMYPSKAALAWQRHTGRRHIISPHGMLDPWAVNNSRWKKRLIGALFEWSHLRGANCVHALCQSEAGAIRGYGLRNPICVIPNGVDLQPLNGSPSKVEDGPLTGIKTEGRKVLLFLGRIHPKKGLLNLLQGWAKTRQLGQKTGQDWVLVIAGWDQEGHEEELKRLTTDLGLFASVLFIGPQFQDAKTRCFESCDAFILPSLSEGLPIVVLEAWSHGKPVLITPECNLPEGFAANAAIRIEPTIESVAAGLEELFRFSSADLHSFGTNGRALAAGRFTWHKIALDMRRVYDWVLGGGPKPDCIVSY
jgi:glycosyltransferase involved in cell wall biosynthesis